MDEHGWCWVSVPRRGHVDMHIACGASETGKAGFDLGEQPIFFVTTQQLLILVTLCFSWKKLNIF